MASGPGRARAARFATVGLPADVPHERSYDRSRQLPAMSVRVRPTVRPRTLRLIVKHLRATRLFGTVFDVERASERIAAMHGPQAVAWLRRAAYRERHQPQGTLTGERARHRRLDWPTVREIRALSAAGVSQQQLARQFGVSQPTIGQVVSGTTWRDGAYRPPPTIWERAQSAPCEEFYDDGFESFWSGLVGRVQESERDAVEALIDRLVRGWIRVRERSCRVAYPQPSQEELFDVFWRAYPRRVGKGEARKAWMRLTPSHELVQQMLATLAWQVKTDQWVRDDGQYIPHPATWLRQERWEDEPLTLTRPSNTGKPTSAAYSIESARAALEAMNRGTTDEANPREQSGTGGGADALGPGDEGEGRARHLRGLRGGHGAVSHGRRS